MILPGPIVVIEDDQDDQQILEVVFKELEYYENVIFFADAEKALQYLTTTTTKPFLIFSDINMPKISGIQLRAQLLARQFLAHETPFLFLTTSTNKNNIKDAYSNAAHGYFIKPNSYLEFKEMIKSIIEYWQKCEAPIYVL